MESVALWVVPTPGIESGEDFTVVVVDPLTLVVSPVTARAADLFF